MKIKSKFIWTVSLIVVSVCTFYGYTFSDDRAIKLAILGCGLCIVFFEKPNIKLNNGDLLWIIFLGIMFIGCFYSIAMSVALKSMAVFAIFLFFKIVISCCTGWEEINRKTMLIFSGTHAAFTVLQFMIPSFVGTINTKILTNTQIATNEFLFQYNYYAGITSQTGVNSFFISVFLAIIFGMLVYGGKKKPIIIVFFVIGIIALLLTGKRGPLFSNIIAALFVLWVSTSSKGARITKRLRFIFISSLIIYAIVQILPQTGNVFYRISNETGTMSGRNEIFSLVYNNFLESPIWGNGTSSTSTLIGISGHNIYLQLLSELGIIGFTIFLIAFFTTLISSVKAYAKNEKNEILNNKVSLNILISIYIQVYFMVNGLTGNPLYYYFILLPYMIMTAIPATYLKNIDKRRIPVKSTKERYINIR